ncbi:hypothetical protein SAMN05421824_1289 [Hyunsoonleella jejuensis]|uniref:Uncharacterized protein n=1 Tax=Hyunsoonleella jejuensis TaxID=419940 RepID=A0A1H9DQ30_9FLAO|nr:hypothetical protein SAMN05421824_1289 [Hyunsoonleella jejuensis]
MKAYKYIDVTALGIEAFVEAPRRERLPKARPFALRYSKGVVTP